MDTAMDNPSYFAVNQGLQRRTVPLQTDRQRTGWNKSESASMGRTRRADRSGGNKCLTRSFSSNVEETRLLVMGQPRPADVAPSVKHTRHTSAGHKDSLQHDLVHCNLQPDGNVFFSSSGDVRYSNLKSPLQGGRRHSISSFGNYSSRRTLSDCMAKSPRARLSSGSDPKGMKSDSPDIVIISSGDSEAAMMWINFLIQCFQHFNQKENKLQYRIQRVRLEDVLSDVMSAPRQERYSQARLQIVLVCPVFLERVLAHSGRSDSLCALLQTNRMLALLVGVTEADLTDQHKTVLVHFDEWRKMVVKDQDRESVGDFYGVSMDILNKATHVPQSSSLSEDDAKFSITPKKIKVGQNKILILLTEPLTSEDNVVVTVDKNGHKIEMTSVTKRNPYTLQFKMPMSCLQVSVLVSIIVEKNGQLLGRRSVKCESRMRELDQLLRSLDNPLNFLCQTFGLHPTDREQLDSFLTSAYLKNVPPNFHLLKPAGSRSQYCHEEYPTMLHFAAKFGLEKLTWQLLESPGGEQACQLRNSCQMTPVDLAEASKHQKLAHALKGHMQMTELTSMYSLLKGISEGHQPSPQRQPSPCRLNPQPLQPQQSSLQRSRLGSLQDFHKSQTTLDESSSGRAASRQSQDSEYLVPRAMDDNYLIPPPPRPVEQSTTPAMHHSYTNLMSSGSAASSNMAMLNYQVPPPPQSLFSTNYQVPTNGRPYNPVGGGGGEVWSSSTPPNAPSSPVDDAVETDCGYLEMSPNISSMGSANYLQGTMSLSDSVFSGKMAIKSSDVFIPRAGGGSNPTLSAPQDDLLEIIEDFQSDVLTLNQVENLVEIWRNRHDVKINPSFEEQQRQLDQIRVQYEGIHRRMKDNLKRPTPFERIKIFFGKNKSKQPGNSQENLTKTSHSEQHQSKRPSSSLSLQSSSSSTSCGQSSTMSTCSANENNAFIEHSGDSKLPTTTAAASTSYFDQPHTFSTFLQGGKPAAAQTADFSGHDYGNVAYSPLGSTAAETIVEETAAEPAAHQRPSRVLGASTIRCMAGIACSLASLPSPDGHEDGRADGREDSEQGPRRYDEVENKVQQLFDRMPAYTNVPVPAAAADQSRGCKYAPLQTTI